MTWLGNQIAKWKIDLAPSFLESNKAAMQSALTGYFNTHSLGIEDISPGLTIPWVSAEKEDATWGFLVATGRLSDEGAPVFKASILENISEPWANRYDYELALKP